MNKVELLAPAGNFECLKAAVNNGADAVYLGGKNFSARAFANNFDNEELIEAVKYAHLRNVKIYVTVNTLLNELEFNNAIKMIDFYYQNNVDALLIQDLGLYYFIKNKYPDFEIHCSTQMHVHNLKGVETAKQLGFKRVVLARESSLDLIRDACKLCIEVETFVHGAICVSYSGQCLMSSVSKNRSANKGMCAQCCRLQYELFDQDNNKINTDTKYPISPKDMFLLNDISKLIEAGVSSFKIEGRMKSSAYVGYVTSIYRKAIDNVNYSISNQELKNLKVLFNRDFTNDYLYSKNDLFKQISPNHLGIQIGSVIKQTKDLVYIKLDDVLNQFDGIRIDEFGCIVNLMYKNDLLVNKAEIGDVVAIKCDQKVKGKVYKTLDYKLEKEINEREDKRLPLNIKIELYPDSNVKVSLNNEYIYLSEYKAQQAINSALNEENIIKQFSKLNETIYYLNNIEVHTDNAFLPVKMLNDIRRKAIEEYNKYRLSLFKRTIIESNIKFAEEKHNENIDLILKDDLINNEFKQNYVINNDSKYVQTQKAIISEIGGLLLDYNEKIAYYTLNCSNSYCYEFLKKLGFDYIILSSELDDNSIDNLIKAYKQRNNIDIKPYVLQSGNRVLMYMKANPFDKYINSDKKYYLKDFNNTYLIKKNHNITEIIEDKFSNSELLFTIYNK